VQRAGFFSDKDFPNSEYVITRWEWPELYGVIRISVGVSRYAHYAELFGYVYFFYSFSGEDGTNVQDAFPGTLSLSLSLSVLTAIFQVNLG